MMIRVLSLGVAVEAGAPRRARREGASWAGDIVALDGRGMGMGMGLVVLML